MDRKCIYTAFYIQEQWKAEYCVSIHSPVEGLCVGMFAVIMHLHRDGRVISFIAFIWIWSDSIDVYRSESIFCFCRLWQVMQFNLDRWLLFFVSIILINGSRIQTLLTHLFTLCPPGLLAPSKQLLNDNARHFIGFFWQNSKYLESLKSKD